MKPIPELQSLASARIGDNGTPNLFFVCDGSTVVMVTTDGDAAYRHWRGIPRNRESSLEDRQTGVLADNAPASEGSEVLVVCDDYVQFKKRKRVKSATPASSPSVTPLKYF